MKHINDMRILAGLDPIINETMDHAAYQERLKKLTDDQLRFIIKDATEAMRVNPDATKSRNGYYADEVNYAQNELYRRRNINNKPIVNRTDEDLKGPFTLKSGKTVFYDTTEGRYYDKSTDMYVDVEDGDIQDSYTKKTASRADEAEEKTNVPVLKFDTQDAFTSDEFEKLLKKAVNNVSSEYYDADVARMVKYKTPPEVIKACKDRIKEIEDSIAIDDEKGYNDKSIKPQVIEYIEQILQNLSSNDQEGYKQAVIFYNGLASQYIHWFPNQLINYLHRG